MSEVLSNFGDFFKKLRQNTGYTLRKFCEKNQLNPGNISKIERNVIPPPSTHEVLVKYASYLGIEPNSVTWNDFFDRAAACNGRIPNSIMSRDDLMAKLPFAFKQIRGEKPSSDILEMFPEDLREI